MIRSSKRARVPTVIYESQDPEMDQIIKTIKKQEEEEKKGDTPVKVRKKRRFNFGLFPLNNARKGE